MNIPFSIKVVVHFLCSNYVRCHLSSYLDVLFLLQEAGDFASVAYFVLRNRCPEKGRFVKQSLLHMKKGLLNRDWKEENRGWEGGLGWVGFQDL